MRARRLQATSLSLRAELHRDRPFGALTSAEARALLYDWAFWARANQLPPDGEWRVWLVLAGRGFGKTRTGAEMIRARVAARMAHRLALVAPTAGDSAASNFLSLSWGVSFASKLSACSSWLITGKKGLLRCCGEH